MTDETIRCTRFAKCREQGRVRLPSMLCFADATGEALSGLLRPGNAGANTVG